VSKEDEGEWEDKSQTDLAEDFSPWKYDFEGLFEDAKEPKKLKVLMFSVQDLFSFSSSHAEPSKLKNPKGASPPLGAASGGDGPGIFCFLFSDFLFLDFIFKNVFFLYILIYNTIKNIIFKVIWH
jgi:hypothetical protein